MRAGLKDALAETDVPAPDDARSVPDQFPAIDGIIDRLAAEAGSKHARTSQLHRIVTLDVAIEAVREGAAAGVAASEARVREAAEALRLLSDPDDPPFADWSFIDPAEAREEAMQAFARSALAALLSEEPADG